MILDNVKDQEIFVLRPDMKNLTVKRVCVADKNTVLWKGRRESFGKNLSGSA